MKEKDYCLEGEQEVSSSLKGWRMQMNALRTKQVSHMGSLYDSINGVDVDMNSARQSSC